jgi:hypothetical protein
MSPGVSLKRLGCRALVEKNDLGRELAAADSRLGARASLQVAKPLSARTPSRGDDETTAGRVVADDFEHNPTRQTRLPASNGEVHESLAEQPPELRPIEQIGKAQQPPQRRPSRIELRKR